MQLALLLLFLVILVFIVILKLYFIKEGFNSHSDFVLRQQKQFGNIGVSLLSTRNDGNLGTSANKYLNTFGEKQNYPLKEERDGLWVIMDKCESIKTADCNSFDDPKFALNCGLCLGVGTNSEKAPTTGGLVLLDMDKKSQEATTKRGFMPDYLPTVGFCPAGTLVATKSQCLKLQKELLCQKNSSYDIPGCSQCLSSGSYSIVDPKATPGLVASSGVIYVAGVGILNFKEDGFGSVDGIVLSQSPYSITIRGNGTTRIKLSVSPPSDSNVNNPTIPFLKGYISGPTFGGEYSTDLKRIVLADELSGRKPRTTGKDTLNKIIVSKMAPAFGQTNMVLNVIVPFSFVDTESEEATRCKNGPFITTEEGANFLESDPCYKKGSGPGKYSLECLQATWISNGCTQAGSGYPSDTSKASDLMTAEDGSSRTINDISDYIYNNSVITATSINENGEKQSIKDWSEASVFCTGNEISSPCEGPTKDTGPLTPDCISFLWNNQGASKLLNGSDNPIGPTYNYGDAYSLFSNGAILRGCQSSGYMSPIDTNGVNKTPVVQYWQSQGGVANVQTIMRNLHAAANAQASSDDTRAPYFKNCYGNIQYSIPSVPVVVPPPEY